MKVIFTCGGTAGHVNPALALAGYMKQKDADTQILFVGAERGLERDLLAHTDYLLVPPLVQTRGDPAQPCLAQKPCPRRA